MDVIVKPRQAGKTTDIIKIAAKNFSYIICPNLAQVKYIAKAAKDMGVDIPYPLTWREFLENKYYGRGIDGGFVIDNLDQCIQQMTPVEIKAVSLNGSTGQLPHEEKE